jgi:hypothetical protein
VKLVLSGPRKGSCH